MRAGLKRSKRRRLSVQALESRRLLAADAGVIPVDANAFGTTYGELAGDWWNWAVIEPAATNPVLDETGEFADANQSGKIWFLAGSFGNDPSGPPTERSVTIPTGKAVFFPVLNTVFFATEPEDTEESLREGANAFMDNPQSLSVTVDGRDIDASKYRAESPDGGFTLSIPEGSLFTGFVPADDYAPAVADGYWILLAPLSRGTHEISFSGTSSNGFFVNVSYEIEVVGGKDAPIAVPIPAVFTSSQSNDEDTDLAVVEFALNDEADEQAPAANSRGGGNEAAVVIKKSAAGDNAAAKNGGDNEVDLALLDLMQLGV